MYIIYVRTYICMYVHIYRYVPIVGGIGGPLRDKFWADFGAKKLGQKNRDHKLSVNGGIRLNNNTAGVTSFSMGGAGLFYVDGPGVVGGRYWIMVIRNWKI